MSFEQIVRPFQSRPVTATKRVIRSVVTSPTEPLTATLTWGAAGEIVQGAKQVQGVDLEAVGFTLNRCNDDWKQVGQPETELEEIPIYSPDESGTQIGKTTSKRVTKISFKKKGDLNPPSNAYFVAGQAEITAGLRASIPGSDSCSASYKYQWE